MIKIDENNTQTINDSLNSRASLPESKCESIASLNDRDLQINTSSNAEVALGDSTMKIKADLIKHVKRGSTKIAPNDNHKIKIQSKGKESISSSKLQSAHKNESILESN